eukprot:4713816-Pyramimonas_sp.AAC.1
MAAPPPPKPHGAPRRTRSPPRVGPRNWRPSSGAARTAGADLLRHFLQLYGSCKMSAKDFCTACWHCDKAEVPGAAFGMYALSPESQTGAFQSHLDR